MPTYLEQLTLRLATGVAALPEPQRRRHAAYFLAAQREDGGFAGREGGSDLYYTGFALRALAILGELYGPVAERAGEFLRARLRGQESIVDFFSLLYGGMLLQSAAGIDIFRGGSPVWRDAVAAWLETLRRDDGGYAKGPDGAASSTYHTFLVILCLELIGRTPPQAERIRDYLRGQWDDEGGFREIRAGKRAGTNPTAAGVAAWRLLGGLPAEFRSGVIDFLADMQTDEGGLRANTRIPIADLLSTFTGLVTLTDLQAAAELDLPAAGRFVAAMERESGGFRAAEWDPAHDVEYSFYGLGCLALLAD